MCHAATIPACALSPCCYDPRLFFVKQLSSSLPPPPPDSCHQHSSATHHARRLLPQRVALSLVVLHLCAWCVWRVAWCVGGVYGVYVAGVGCGVCVECVVVVMCGVMGGRGEDVRIYQYLPVVLATERSCCRTYHDVSQPQASPYTLNFYVIPINNIYLHPKAYTLHPTAHSQELFCSERPEA